MKGFYRLTNYGYTRTSIGMALIMASAFPVVRTRLRIDVAVVFIVMTVVLVIVALIYPSALFNGPKNTFVFPDVNTALDAVIVYVPIPVRAHVNVIPPEKLLASCVAVGALVPVCVTLA